MQSLSSHFSPIAQLFPFFAANRFKDLGYNMQRTGMAHITIGMWMAARANSANASWWQSDN